MESTSLKKTSEISSNSIDIIFDPMITEDRYPGKSRRISEIVHSLETSNATSGNDVRETLGTHHLDDFHDDYSHTCTTKRNSTGRLERVLVDKLFLLVKWSCTANNKNLVNELMILLGYKSYEKKPDRFRQKMENELKKRRSRKDTTIHASRMKNPPKKTNKKQPKIKQEEIKVKQEGLLSVYIKQEESADSRSSIDYLGPPYSDNMPGISTQYPLSTPLSYSPNMDSITNPVSNAYQDDPLTRELNTDADDSASLVPLLPANMNENMNVGSPAENIINPPSAFQMTNTEVDILNPLASHQKSIVTSLEHFPRESDTERRDIEPNGFPSMDDLDPPSVDILSYALPNIPQDEIEMQPILFNDQFRQDLFNPGQIHYDQDISPCDSFGI